MSEQAKCGIFVCVSWALALALLLFPAIWMMGWTGVLIALAIWVIIITSTAQFFTTWSPKIRAIITNDALRKDAEGNGVLTVHPPGLTWKYPTEVESGDFIPLGYIAETFPITCPTKDGPDVTIIVSFRWHPINTTEGLKRFLLVRDDPGSICVGVTGKAKSILSQKTRTYEVLEAEEKIKELQGVIDEEFGREPDPVADDTDDTDKALSLEEKFGIDVTIPTVELVMSSVEFKRGRTTRRIMDELRASAKEAVDASDGSLRTATAMDRILTVHSGGDVSQHTQLVQGENLGEQLAALFVAAMSGRNQQKKNEKDTL
ncbi:hypothetical protein CL630_02915 [bacterium]|nr:hypothetical protein [bacterium]|tara:strand:- start:1497 stop:2447 length:951 start_codon:yes stop_codon:yes gene_type:complete